MQRGRGDNGDAALRQWRPGQEGLVRKGRAVQGEDVGSPLDRRYCGGGSLAECRKMLLRTLGEAAATPAEETYPGDKECDAGDEVCADSIVHRAMGGITVPRVAWQNRPTYQQVVEFPGRR